MKGFLQDLVAHTHSLGTLPLIRVTATTDKTYIDSVTEDKVMILNATTHTPISELSGVFGMSSLNKLDLHLKCPEYVDANITLITDIRNDELIPVGLHFENQNGDFQNDFTFISRHITDLKIKNAEFLGTQWDIEFEPSLSSIQRLKFQIAAHTEEAMFQLTTVDGNLVLSFGDRTSHAGSFIFQPDVGKSLKNKWSWPKHQILSVLNLDGDKKIKLMDAGALQITVDSGICQYNYIFRGQK